MLIIIFDQSIIKIIMFEIPYYVWARGEEVIKKVLWFLFLIKLYEKGLYQEQMFDIIDL